MGYLEIKGYSQELDLFVEENTRFMIFKECPDTSLTYGSLKYFITIAPLYLFFIFYFLNFYFYFILLYNTVLVLPYIDMNPPRVYMRSQT